jgi:hypothetical protein
MRCFLANEKALSKELELGLRRALFISMTGSVSSRKSGRPMHINLVKTAGFAIWVFQ